MESRAALEPFGIDGDGMLRLERDISAQRGGAEGVAGARADRDATCGIEAPGPDRYDETFRLCAREGFGACVGEGAGLEAVLRNTARARRMSRCSEASSAGGVFSRITAAVQNTVRRSSRPAIRGTIPAAGCRLVGRRFVRAQRIGPTRRPRRATRSILSPARPRRSSSSRADRGRSSSSPFVVDPPGASRTSTSYASSRRSISRRVASGLRCRGAEGKRLVEAPRAGVNFLSNRARSLQYRHQNGARASRHFSKIQRSNMKRSR